MTPKQISELFKDEIVRRININKSDLIRYGVDQDYLMEKCNISNHKKEARRAMQLLKNQNIIYYDKHDAVWMVESEWIKNIIELQERLRKHE